MATNRNQIRQDRRSSYAIRSKAELTMTFRSSKVIVSLSSVKCQGLGAVIRSNAFALPSESQAV